MESTDHSWSGVHKIGGIALLVEGIAYLVIAVTGAMIGVTPGNSERWLDAVATHPVLSEITYGLLTGIADLVLIPGAFALYLVLRKVSKNAMLVAAGILLAYVAIDISTFVLTSTAIVGLTQSYAATANATQRVAILGAEYYGLATIPLSQFLGWFFPSFGYLIAALVIRKGNFGRLTAILGILASVVDIVASFAFWFPGTYLETFLTPGLTLLGLFALSAGLMLFKLGRRR